jgi:hypothetical protein
MPARHRDALIAAAAAGSVTALLAWLGPPGTDFAAHAYQRALFIRHGLVLWDNYWYAGRYSFVGYSVLYYPLAAVLGIRLLATLAAAVAAFAFAELVAARWGVAARWPIAAFALVWGGFVLTGAFPFALGVTFALLALRSLQSRRPWLFAFCVVLTLATSPVALVLLGVVLLGLAAACGWQRGPAIVVGVAVATQLVLGVLFRTGGHYPFPVSEAVATLAFCAAGLACTWRVDEARVLRPVFAAYAVAVVAVWIVPTDLGENVARLRYVAFPVALLVLALRRWQPVPVAALLSAAALAWNVTPLVAGWQRGAEDVTKNAAVWRAPLAWLHAHLTSGYRVEAVDTSAHWPAYYLPDSGIPIVRGWFRQEDFPANAILYGRFTAREYVAWLHSLGVAYVVLSDAPPDHSSRRESVVAPAALHRPVFTSPHIAIYAVPHPRPITRATVLAFTGSSLTVRAPRAGTYRIAVHWSPYWRASSGTLSRGSDGMIELTTSDREIVRLTLRFG